MRFEGTKDYVATEDLKVAGTQRQDCRADLLSHGSII